MSRNQSHSIEGVCRRHTVIPYSAATVLPSAKRMASSIAKVPAASTCCDRAVALSPSTTMHGIHVRQWHLEIAPAQVAPKGGVKSNKSWLLTLRQARAVQDGSGHGWLLESVDQQPCTVQDQGFVRRLERVGGMMLIHDLKPHQARGGKLVH